LPTVKKAKTATRRNSKHVQALDLSPAADPPLQRSLEGISTQSITGLISGIHQSLVTFHQFSDSGNDKRINLVQIIGILPRMCGIFLKLKIGANGLLLRLQCPKFSNMLSVVGLTSLQHCVDVLINPFKNYISQGVIV
jgi:hypothetical protein